MNNDTPADAITVIQADRDLVYSLFWFGAKTELEKRALEYIRDGKGDDARAVQEVARHRTTSLAAQDGLVEALRPLVDLQHQKGAWAIIHKSVSDFEPVTLTVTKRQMLDLLSAIKGDKS